VNDNYETQTQENNYYIDNNQQEVRDIGINTDDLPPEVLQRIVENNQELIEINMEENKEKEKYGSKLKHQKELEK